MQDLNSIQQDAARHIEGPMLLLAGAGSGKTNTLTHRIAHIIEDKGYSPYSVAAITFTNKAAEEMRNRVHTLCRNSKNVWISTFHRLGIRILRRDIDRIGYTSSFTIYDADSSQSLIKQCISQLNLSEEKFKPKQVASEIGNMKDKLLTPKAAIREYDGEWRKHSIAQIYALYQQNLIQNDALDFDDIIMQTVNLLQTSPQVLEYYQDRFKYIMVDEYQDTSHAQYVMIKLLSAKHNNICVVGDDDQSIYAFRGANIRNILDFEKDFPGARVLKLEQNYRSTTQILDAANAVIRNNKDRKPKALWTDRTDGELPVLFHAENEWNEGDFIVRTIAERMQQGHPLSGNAILYRSASLSRNIEEALVRAGIPYRIVSGTRFYDRKEIRDLLAYLRVLNNPRDSLAIMRIINVPRRGIGPATVDRLMEYAQEKGITLIEAIAQSDDIEGLSRRREQLTGFADLIQSLTEASKTMDVGRLIERILVEAGYKNELQQDSSRAEEVRNKLANLEQLMIKAQDFVNSIRAEVGPPEGAEDELVQRHTSATLGAFLEEVSLVTSADEAGEGEAVSLMTVHASKGLEFDCVFLAGMEERIFPSQFTLQAESPEKELQEERRLCYVGITRARSHLYISAAKSRRRAEKTEYNRISRFIEEIPDDLLYKKTGVSGYRMNEASESPNKESGQAAKERTGISRYAEINKVRNSIDISFGGKNYMRGAGSATGEQAPPSFQKGDKVRQIKYGVGTVVDIRPTGADTELTVEFESVGSRKFLASLSKLKKA